MWLKKFNYVKNEKKKNISKDFTLSLASDCLCVILVDHGLHVLRDRHDVAVVAAADKLAEVAVAVAVGHVAVKNWFLKKKNFHKLTLCLPVAVVAVELHFHIDRHVELEPADEVDNAVDLHLAVAGDVEEVAADIEAEADVVVVVQHGIVVVAKNKQANKFFWYT